MATAIRALDKIAVPNAPDAGKIQTILEEQGHTVDNVSVSDIGNQWVVVVNGDDTVQDSLDTWGPDQQTQGGIKTQQAKDYLASVWTNIMDETLTQDQSRKVLKAQAVLLRSLVMGQEDDL